MQISFRRRGFTLIEMLTVIAIIGVLAGLLLPALNSARERGRRIACLSNMKQIGVAILSYAGDHQNHTPTAMGNSGSTTWDAALTNGYTTAKVFQCPDDRRPSTPTKIPRSYGIIVADSNPASEYWIAGSRLTCPYLTNTDVAIVGEVYSTAIQPTLADTGTTSVQYVPPTTITQPPMSRHDANNTLAGNFLFLDGRVEWVDHPESHPEMFPKKPAGTPPFCP